MAERIQRAGQTHAMELIFFPLIVLILVGLIANAFQSSAIQTVPVLPPNPGSFCTGNIEPGECYPTNVNGCDQSVSNCNFTSKTTFSFLNPNSPFTILLQGNIIGFLSYALTGGERPNQIFSGYTICIPQVAGVYANQSGSTQPIHNFQCLGYTANGAGSHPFPQTGVPLNASSNDGNNSQWIAQGCNLITPSTYDRCILNYGNGIESFNGTQSQASFFGFYIKNGSTINSGSNCKIGNSVVSCIVSVAYLFYFGNTFTCPNTAHVNGININATTYYCLLPTANPTIPTSADVTNSLSNSFGALAFIFGAILLFLGLGLAITTALVGFTINEQGTRMAQAMGLGIIVWTFIFGEFGGWLNFLPFNLGTIGFITLTIPFFLGLYWRLFAWE